MGKVTAKSLANLRPWPAGISPNPAGRPIGARSKLNELALKLLHADFAIHGEETIRRVREKKPEVYLASVVSLLPKQAEKIASPFVDLSDEELEQLEHLLAAMRARTISQIVEHPNAQNQRLNELPRHYQRKAQQNTNARSTTNGAAAQGTIQNGHADLGERHEQAPLVSDSTDALGSAAPQQEDT